ncbi:hypothetical protein KJQ97_08835 [Campylobacter sp. 2018MI01]|uniref:hypothetical protein n=3 Tax=unclassified Campylobacter TaxID=2593542 RepID=UPI001BD9B342|nr:hypothetical protein [Campylobacter sp. 2018MI01]MBT0879527.1 hypothetical protein [Campylobacter sp. 2018MI01]
MKKILISLFCIGALNASSISEIEKLKQENEILKQRIDALENKFYDPFDDFFKSFDAINKQHIKALNEIKKSMEDDFKNYKSNSNYSSYFQINNIISYMKQTSQNIDNKTNSKIEIKTYNENTKKEYLLKDIIKDFDTFKVYFNSKNLDKNIELDKFYISSNGFVFLSKDLKNQIIINFEDMKIYLKDEFLKELSL